MGNSFYCNFFNSVCGWGTIWQRPTVFFVFTSSEWNKKQFSITDTQVAMAKAWEEVTFFLEMISPLGFLWRVFFNFQGWKAGYYFLCCFRHERWAGTDITAALLHNLLPVVIKSIVWWLSHHPCYIEEKCFRAINKNHNGWWNFLRVQIKFTIVTSIALLIFNLKCERELKIFDQKYIIL